MLNPEVIELLDDPDLGGGVAFLVVRKTNKRSLLEPEGVTEEFLTGTGNIQPSGPDQIQVLPEEMRHDKVIVIYTTFAFHMGEDGSGGYTSPDLVLWDGRMWDVLQVDDWAKWGYHVAYATERKGRMPDAYAARMADLL